MSRSLKFPVAVHTLVALACMRDRYVSSEVLAESIGTNPVVVRRMLLSLKKAGLVESKGGAQGGAALKKPPEEITLLDVDRAVGSGDAGMHDGDSTCWIARGIQHTVPAVLDEAELARREALARHTIADLAGRVAADR